MKYVLIITGAVFVSVACFVTLWLGVVPIRYTPLPHVDLETTPHSTWIDPFEQIRITSMRFDKKTCKEVLKKPYIDAVPLKSNLKSNGCGWVNGFKVRRVAGAKLGRSGAVLSCEMATSLAIWMQHVQERAEKIYGVPIVKIHHYGTYNCRKIRNSWMPSQHSYANGIDIDLSNPNIVSTAIFKAEGGSDKVLQIIKSRLSSQNTNTFEGVITQ